MFALKDIGDLKLFPRKRIRIGSTSRMEFEFIVGRNRRQLKNMNRTLNAILLSAGLCSLPNLCFSAIVYDNTAANLNQQYFPTPATFEFGDQITLTGSERTLSQFSFYYDLSGS